MFLERRNCNLKGKLLQVVKISNRIPEVDENALSSILLDSRVRDNKVVVVSVVRVAEEGRSLFLNSFLKFLNSSTDEQWMDRPSPEELHRRFRYDYPRSHDGITTGIYLSLPPCHLVYILLMETRGLFGNISNDSWELEPESFCRINRHSRNISFDAFGLSAFLSSVLIYNIKADIRSHFHDLQMLTEYARMLLENCTDKPFQNLHFVVRDWNSPETFPFGDEGGMQLLECRKEEAQEQCSTKSFENIKCFLMPKMTENDNLSVVKPDFTSNLRTFTESLFAKNNVEVKTVEGKKATGSELMKYFKLYAKNFSEHKLRTLKKTDSYGYSGRKAPSLTSRETFKDEVIIVERIFSFYSWENAKENAEKSILNKIDFDELHGKWHEEALRMFRASSSEPEGRSSLDEKRLKKILDGRREEDYNKLHHDIYKRSSDISFKLYVRKMVERNGFHLPYTLPLLLERDHCRFFFKAINMFRSFGNHGFEEMQMNNEVELENKICKVYDVCKRINRAKMKYNFRNGFDPSDISYSMLRAVDEPVNKLEESSQSGLININE